MRYLLALSALAVLTAPTLAQEFANLSVEEKWNCIEPYSSGPVLVTATRYSEKMLEIFWGKIEVAGTEHIATFSIQGFDRRWNFGDLDDDGSYPYAFVIKPNGDGLYYDFTLEARTKASQLYECRQMRK